MTVLLNRSPLTLVAALFLLCCSLLTPTLADARQQVAAIIVSDLPRYRQAYEAMVSVLKAGGFDESKLKLFTQTPGADKMSLINSLRRTKAANVDLVITFGSQVTALARQELGDTPLLFADVYDPVAIGVVKNLAAPGTDATGATSYTDLTTLVEAVQTIKPLGKVGVLFTANEPGAEQQLAEMRAIADRQNIQVVAESATNPRQAVTLAQQLSRETDALYLTVSLAVAQKASEIAGQLGPQKLIFSQIPGLVEAGALIGLESDPAEQGKLVAVQALQILQGQKAHLLPVRSAKKVRLLVNRQTAAALGLDIPAPVAAEATYVN